MYSMIGSEGSWGTESETCEDEDEDEDEDELVLSWKGVHLGFERSAGICEACEAL